MIPEPVRKTLADKVLEVDPDTVREPRCEELEVEDTVPVTVTVGLKVPLVVELVVRETETLLEAVGLLVAVFDPPIDLVRVTEAVMLRVATGVLVTVLEFVVLVVVVPVPVSVRDDLLVTETDGVAVTVFEADTLAVAVQVVSTDLLLAGERVSEGVPVEVFEDFSVAEPVVDAVLVLDGFIEPVILELPVIVFDELIEPVFVFEVAMVRLGAGLRLAVLVPLVVRLIAGLAVDVFEGMAVQVL